MLKVVQYYNLIRQIKILNIIWLFILTPLIFACLKESPKKKTIAN